MATIKGKWVWNENVSTWAGADITETKVNFTSNGQQFEGIVSDGDSSTRGMLYIPIGATSSSEYVHVYNSTTKTWLDEAYRTIDFGTTEQEVPDYYETFTDIVQKNATQLPDEPSTKIDAVTITYNNTTIASIESGKTATLHCADKKMASDIVVTAPEIPEVNLQEKTVTENCEATPDEGYDGFSKVTVNVPIPDGYLVPSGTKEITENGTHDVTEFESVTINVPIPSVEVYDGMVTVSGGMISFTIDNVSYEAEDGMTWGEWVDSDYNTDNYLDAIGMIIKNDNGSLSVATSNDVFVSPSDSIISNYTYILKLNGEPA